MSYYNNSSYNGPDMELKYPIYRGRDTGSTYLEHRDNTALIQQWESSEDLDVSLHQAARDGDVGVMEKLLNNITSKKRRKVNELDENTLAPLHYAARYNHLEVAKLLVENGANPDRLGEDSTTPLHHAARFRRSRQHSASAEDASSGTHSITAEEKDWSVEEVHGVPCYTVTTVVHGSPWRPDVSEWMFSHPQLIEPYLVSFLRNHGLLEADGTLTDKVDADNSVIFYLESCGADVNAQDIYGLTPLHFAAMRANDVAALELLHCKDIRIEAADKQNMTPLHIACTHGSEEVTAMLIKRGAAIRCKDEQDNTPLHMACAEGHTEIVKLLFSAGEDQNVLGEMLTDRESNNYGTALHLAIDGGEKEIIEICLNHHANVNAFCGGKNTPLHFACESSNLEMVRLLVSRGAIINSRNLEQSTPLHKACQTNRHKVVEFLLQNGGNVERRDKDNFTPLLIAASEGHTATIEVLLRYKANISAKDKHEKTAIYWAAEEKQLDALKVLLDAEGAADLIDESDRYDSTALHIASEKGYLSIVKLLLDRGADVDAKNEDEMTPLHLAAQSGHVNCIMEFVRRDESSVNDEDDNSNTPLHLAALEGRPRAISCLIEAGADIEARNQSLWTPLDCAASRGWVKSARILLEADCPVDPADKAKVTPLHLASMNGHVDMVELLLKWKADVGLKDSENRNCLDHAIDNGHTDVALTIIRHKNWREAMCSVSEDSVTGVRQTPLRKLIRKMPDVAEEVLNLCLTENDKPREHPAYSITFNYELLDDMFSTWNDDSEDGASTSDSASEEDENYPFNEAGKLLAKARAYSDSEEVLKVNHPLVIMVKSKRDNLLGHPLVTSLLAHKWASYGRIFYYLSFLLYLLFLTLFTGFIIVNPPPYFLYDPYGNGSSMVWYPTGEARWTEGYSGVSKFIFVEIGHWVILGLCILNLLKEIVQLYNQKTKYIDMENFLEWCIYVLAILTVLPINSYEYAPGLYLRSDWQWQCGAFGIFFAWVNLILFIQKFPRLGIYVVMFTDILKTFLNFVLVFFLFIVAFAMAFYTLLLNQEPFHRFQYSLVKTFVMMIGEFEFDSIFHAQDYLQSGGEQEGEDTFFLTNVFYKGTTYTIFVIFAVIMSILIMNLLVGLAVDDIKEVQEQAKLKRFGMQVDLAFEVQEALPRFIWRRSIIKNQTVYPNRGLSSRYARWKGWLKGDDQFLTEAITTALNPELGPMEVLQKKQEEVIRDVSNIKSRLKQLQSTNDSIERMLHTILLNQNISHDASDASEEIAE